MTGIPHADRPVDVGFVGASGCGLAVARAATVLTGAPDASAASSSALAVRIPRTPPALHEAMAYGLSIITTCWRNIPDVMPANYSGLVEPRSPKQIAAMLYEDRHLRGAA